MKKTTHAVAALILALGLSGCQQQAADTPAPQQTTSTTAAHDEHDGHDHAAGDAHETHDHGAATASGTLKVAGHQAKVLLTGALTPGAEAFVDISLLSDAPAPKAVRAWIGTEDAAQTGKQLVELGSQRAGHSHVEVPKPLEPGHVLWIELEDDQGKHRASIPLAK